MLQGVVAAGCASNAHFRRLNGETTFGCLNIELDQLTQR
jgi:hypothetical protein